MAPDFTDEARRELDELRELIDECRHELGLGESGGSRNGTQRSRGLPRRRVRGSRQARRRAPVS
jgi:hypothetical protein